MYPKSIQYHTIHTNSSTIPYKIIKQNRSKGSVGAPLHFHEQLEFYFMTKGNISLLCNGNKYVLNAEDIGFINAYTPHRGFEFSDQTEFFTILLDVSQLNKIHSLPRNLNPREIFKYIPKVLKNSCELRISLEQLIQEDCEKKLGYNLMVESNIYAILGTLLRIADAHKSVSTYTNTTSLGRQDILIEILNYITIHYNENFSLDFLSRNFNISKSHLCRLFKQYTNTTINQYIHELRCQNAVCLIKEGYSLNQVSELVGYQDYNYFSRMFKKHYHKSPRQAQKQL